MEAEDLARELGRRIRGEVRFDAGSRALYATDASNYRQVPIGVVVPRDIDDVIATVATCRAFDAPIVGRGGGTSLAGQTCNTAVVIDFSKYVHRVVDLDAAAGSARVEPGIVLDDLRRRAEAFRLTFGPDPATHTHCTLGGMIGNNSCGVHSMMAGCTAENVDELDILTYDGTRLTVGATSEAELESIIAAGGRRGDIYRRLRDLRDRYARLIRERFPRIPRRVSGYDLPALLPEAGTHVARALVGSEGTLVTVLGAKVRLVPSPPARVLLVLGYPSVFEAADHVEEIAAGGAIGLEGVDDVLVSDMVKKKLHAERLELLPPGRGWLLVELGGDTREEAAAQAARLMARLRRTPAAPSMKLFDDPVEEAIVWTIRELGLGATARVPGEADTWEGWEDSAVAPGRLGGYLRELRKLLERHGYRAALYGHFGQGCVHTRIPFDLRTTPGIARFRSFVEEAADLVLAHGGSLSGEHGDGQARAELLPRMYGPELMQAFEEMKAIFDPTNRMNPGKVVHPHRLDANLRLSPNGRAEPVHPRLTLVEDDNSFSRATERCVGVGECRRLDGGTMCPSFMVTREEKHSTRGRARLLFEMMRGETIQDGWQSREVEDALDLCLACKGCKSECPVNVDMAAYKAEFLSRRYAGRLRPRSAYAFGLVMWWARLASLAPVLVNLLMRAPVVGRLAKWAMGADPRRTLPTFAPVSFQAWWRERPVRGQGRPRVVLWVDTFNNHWQPAVAVAGVEALEDAGYQVLVPPASLCCGRPLYDYGMLGLAERFLRRILVALRPALDAELPVVGLEPSCVAVFKDELLRLFPGHPDATRLSARAFMLDEFLLRHAPAWRPPRLHRRALVQGHCHHRAVLDHAPEAALLQRLEVEATVLDAGCCGMAGAFGYERGHYDVSVACAERKLAPAIREAGPETVLVADGFSCRQQIQHETGRRALHLAQVLQMARQQGPAGPRGALPERGYAGVSLARPRTRRRQRVVAAALLAAGLYAYLRRRRA